MHNIVIRILERLVEGTDRELYNTQRVGKIIGYDVGKELGEGAYSVVYSARDVNTGEPVVIKISTNADEWQGYRKAQKVKEKLPENLQKHLPVIYYAGPLWQIKNFSKEQMQDILEFMDLETSLIVMEPLKMLDTRSKQMFFGKSWDNYNKIGKRAKYATEEDTVNLVNILMNEIDEIVMSNYRGKKKKEIIDCLKTHKHDLENMLIKAPAKSITSDQGIKDIFKHWITNSFSSTKLNKFYEVQIAMGGIIAMLSDWWIIQTHEESDVAMGSEEQMGRKLPFTSVGKTFQKLADELHKLGFIYHDMHGSNVMVRPSTGDMVMSDLGMFRDR